MLRTEKQLKIDILASLNFALGGLNSVVSVFVFQGDLLRILLLVDAPVERHENR